MRLKGEFKIMNKYKISVIVPVYNAEKYLRKCLDSIVNQSFKDLEIICVNDGSTDNSLQILNEYSSNFSNVKVINQKNKGIIGARIAGYQNSIGEYIGWVDNDDFIKKDMFEKLYNLANEENADIAICNYEFYPKKIKTKKKWFKEYKGKHDYSFISNNGLLWNKIVKRDLLKKINFIKLIKDLGEGSYTIALLSTTKIVSTDKKLYFYRVGHNSTSSSFIGKTKYYYENVQREKKKLEYIKGMKISKELISYFEYYTLRSKLILAMIAALNKDYQIYCLNVKDLKSSDFFSKEKAIYLKKDFNRTKRIFFKYILINNYAISYLFVKMILR